MLSSFHRAVFSGDNGQNHHVLETINNYTIVLSQEALDGNILCFVDYDQ